jgi:hypothetical protein
LEEEEKKKEEEEEGGRDRMPCGDDGKFIIFSQNVLPHVNTVFSPAGM